MKLRTFQSRMPGYYASGNCITLRSRPGRGKTSVISKAPQIIGEATGKNIGFVHLFAPTLTPADTVGYLIPSKDHVGHAASKFTRPFWWYTNDATGTTRALEEFDGGIIFIDEEDKADPDIKKIIGEMGLSGQCGPHKLPSGWVVWMAGNHRSDRSGSTRELDHLINRRCQLDITDDLKGWVEWAIVSGLNGVAVAFAEQNPNIVFESDPPAIQGPWPTPRSFVECVQHLQCFAGPDGKLPTDNAAAEDAKGYIGAEAAVQLMAFIRLEHDLPSLAEIVADPQNAKLPSRPDSQMLVAYSLAARAEQANMPALVTYCDRLPQEFAILFADSAVTRDSDLINSQAMDDWCQRNGSLMRTISRYRQAQR